MRTTSLKSGPIEFSAGSWPLAPDKPTLVFIHGAAQSRAFWDLQLQGLSGTFNTIAPDLPGHGGSDGPGKERVETYARDMIEFLERIDAPRAIPCGLSMGGGIAIQLLVDYPGSFDGAVLINTGARLKVHPSIVEIVKKDIKEYTDSLKAFALVAGNTTCSAITRIIDDSSDCTSETAVMDFSACNHFDIMEHLETIKTPVLILTAQEDLLTPEKYGIHLNREIRNSQLVSLENCSHFSPVEKPLEVNREISVFMDRLFSQTVI